MQSLLSAYSSLVSLMCQVHHSGLCGNNQAISASRDKKVLYRPVHHVPERMEQVQVSHSFCILTILFVSVVAAVSNQDRSHMHQ